MTVPGGGLRNGCFINPLKGSWESAGGAVILYCQGKVRTLSFPSAAPKGVQDVKHRRFSSIGSAILVLAALAATTASCDLASRAIGRIRGKGPEVGRDAGRPAEAGRVIYLEGDASVSGRSVSIGDAVFDGDVIVTGEESRLELEFGDYRVLRAGENARLTIDLTEETMRLDAGSLAVVQSKARWFSKDKPWILETPTTVAAVRGTFYFTKVESADSTYFCLCNGRIHLEDEERFLDLEAAHHNAVRVGRGAEGIVYQAAPMLYHEDADMESLADLINVPIDWSHISE